MRLWERIYKDSQHFWREFTGIRKTLGEDSQGFPRFWERIHKDSRDFGRGFARIYETLGEDS